MDSQNSGPNWSLYRHIESYVPIKFSIFVAGLYRSMQYSVATCHFSSFLDSVMTDFDNVVTEFWCSSIVLVATGMYCVATPNLFATSSHILLLLESVATNIFLFSLSTLLRQSFSLSRKDFFESLEISIVTENSLVATDFSSLILIAC